MKVVLSENECYNYFACFVQERRRLIKKGDAKMPYGARWDWLWELIGGKDEKEEEE